MEKQLAAAEKELGKVFEKGDEAFEELRAGFVAAASEMRKAVRKALGHL